ncbi:hypothetical protein DQ04_09651020 [Trypanosoma grayi]|uniref:hypothetical protein n=1 Tax=Trypanosoma grayi TaxID=71804 RepID=UPI0004F3FC13|nr:hypothetical protein DQ04_09651020 [Trypanosoma grayi]KEG07487.1 hypothetical protein DQ04_09651020 [Trypanosoma grayi]
MVCAAGFQVGSLFRHYFFLKMVRRRLTGLSRGLADAQDPAAPPPFALKVGQEWLDTLLQKNPVKHPRSKPTSGTLAAGPLYVDGARCCLRVAWKCGPQGVHGSRPPILFHKLKPGPSDWPCSFLKGNMPITLHICIGSTAVMHIMRKGDARSDALGGGLGISTGRCVNKAQTSHGALSCGQ